MRLTWLAISALIASTLLFGRANANDSDAYLSGYIQYILDQELFWEPSSYKVDVVDGNVTLAMTEKSPIKRADAINRIYEVPGIKDVNILVARPDELDGKTRLSRKQTLREKLLTSLGVDPQYTTLPTTNLFPALIADPKQPQFYVSALSYFANDKQAGQFSVGFGETFGILQRPGFQDDHVIQISIMGGLFGQFGFGSGDSGLINQDFNFGIPITYSHGNWAHRLRWYHQSSHLGDEFLLQHPTDVRYDFNFESIEWLVSYQYPQLRYFSGAEILVRRWPFPLDRLMLHAGGEYRSTKLDSWHGGNWIAAIDIKSWQEYDWQPDISLKFGIEFGEQQRAQHQVRWLLEAYHGANPHGQFFFSRNSENIISYFGTGIYFTF